MEAPSQVNKQRQLPAQGRGRRGGGGVRVHGGRIGGRGRGAQRHHAVLDEIQATLMDHEWLMNERYFICVNKKGYNFLGSMSAMCDVKPWKVLLLP